jgi:hypothetical protein
MDIFVVQVALQSVSSLALASTLVYTAVQFRQWRQAQYTANFTKLVELQMQLRRMRVDDPALASVHQGDVEGMQSHREVQEHFLNLMQLSLFEIAWFSHQHGQLPRDYFESWAGRMTEITREPSFHRMWQTGAVKIMHDQFRAYMETLMRDRR